MSSDQELKDRHIKTVQRVGGSRACAPYVIGALVVWIGFYLFPYIVESIHRSKVSIHQMELDGHTMQGLASFRDIPWELWSSFHTVLEDQHWLYILWTVCNYIANASLWYAWFIYRHFKSRAWHLCVKLFFLQVLGIVCNSLNWFPLPPGFIQAETISTTYLFGFVVRSADQFVSPRASWSLILLYDAVKFSGMHKFFSTWAMTIYGINVSLYLLASRQMYSFSMIVNVYAAISAWYIGEDITERLRPMVEGKDTAEAGDPSASGAIFEIETRSDDDDDDDSEVVFNGTG